MRLVVDRVYDHGKNDGQLLALVVRKEKTGILSINPGYPFLTQPADSLQLAFITHPRGTVLKAHAHKETNRKLMSTAEALVVQCGRVRLDLYSTDGTFLQEQILIGGDFALLLAGGHGLTVLQDAEIVEVKQGPFLGDDKILL